MKCPECGSEIKENKDRDVVWDRGRTAFCKKCHIEYRIDDETNDIIYAQPTTAEMQEWLVENKYDILLRKNKSMIHSCTLYFYDENSLKKAIDRAGNTLAEAIKQAYDWAKKQEVTSA